MPSFEPRVFVLLPLLSLALPVLADENPMDTGFVGSRDAEVRVLPKLSFDVPASTCRTILAPAEEFSGLWVLYAQMMFCVPVELRGIV